MDSKGAGGSGVGAAAQAGEGVPLASEQAAGLEEVLCLVRKREGVDLSSYRPSTIVRRVESRLQKLHCQDFQAYARHLAGDPAEARRLVEHVTIKVSRFFRNADVWVRLRDDVLPSLARRGSLRLWSAGCGNGEEVYSLAVLVADLARSGRPGPTATIVGTDVAEDALAATRLGLYAESALEELPSEFRAAYLLSRPGRPGPPYEVRSELRQMVRLLRHDLLAEPEGPPGGPFDLVLCRNVLIYLRRPAQDRVLDLLARSLADGGYLCLGEAEQLVAAQRQRFVTVDRRAGLYCRVAPGWRGDRDATA